MNLRLNRSYSCARTALWVDILMSMITRIRRLNTVTGIGLVSITLLGWSKSGLTLETITAIAAKSGSVVSKPRSQQHVLFVDPTIADKTIGDGSHSAPFKTITQALESAQPSSVIMLAPVVLYNTSSERRFPYG